MHLTITFDEKAFAHSEEQSTTTFDKPDFRKFNMRFNNLDLIIIDAVAKRNGTSRSQIINSFIERILKDFVLLCPKYEALFITEHAESIIGDNTKSDKNFAWDEWYADTALAVHHDYLWIAKNDLQHDIENKNISKELITLINKLEKARGNSSVTKPKS